MRGHDFTWVTEMENRNVHDVLEQTIPGDSVTKVKQNNSQSDLTSMSSFAGPSYLTIRSSVYIICI